MDNILPLPLTFGYVCAKVA